MTSQEVLIYRVGIGNGVGWVIGFIAFVSMPYFVADTNLLFRTALFVWYPTVGVMVGLFGVFKRHPIFKFSMPWWLRGALVGAWMNFVLTLFIYDTLSVIVAAILGEYSRYTSPFLMVIEGALVGMLIDYVVTRNAGDGYLEAT